MDTKLDFVSHTKTRCDVVENPNSIRRSGIRLEQDQTMDLLQQQEIRKVNRNINDQQAHFGFAMAAHFSGMRSLVSRREEEPKLTDPTFLSATINRVTRQAVSKLGEKKMDEMMKKGRIRMTKKMLTDISEIIDEEVEIWLARRTFGFELAQPSTGNAIEVIKQLTTISKSGHRDIDVYEDVRNAKYAPLTGNDIDDIADSYESGVITDYMWKLLAEGDVTSFQENTNLGAFVMHIDEAPNMDENSEGMKLGSTLDALNLELRDPTKRPGKLEGRGLRSRHTNQLLAAVLFRTPPENAVSAEGKNLDAYLINGITGKLDYKVRTAEEYRQKIHQILMWELLLQNKSFAANRLFNLFSQEMLHTMERTNQKVWTILEYQLNHLSIDCDLEDESLVGRYGHNDASANFTTKRGLHPCAYDANPNGPYITRIVDGTEIKITPDWIVKSGDMRKVQAISQREWEREQLMHGDPSKDEYEKKRYL